MILAVNWTVNGLSGSTLSPAFSVVESAAEIDAVRAQLQVSPYAKSTERPNEGGTNTHGGVAPSLPTSAGGGKLSTLALTLYQLSQTNTGWVCVKRSHSGDVTHCIALCRRAGREEKLYASI